VRLPLNGAMCRSYAFDNVRGGYATEREVPCEPEPPSSGGSIARVEGLASGFKR
jgi:hypothetical protein